MTDDDPKRGDRDSVRAALSMVRIRWEAFHQEDKSESFELLAEILGTWDGDELLAGLLLVGANLAEAICLFEAERGNPDPVGFVRSKLIELHVVE